MKKSIMTGLLACLTLMVGAAVPPSWATPVQGPPVAQPLVREGDFAVGLVEALGLGRTENEAEAESMLSAAGIVPRNGWIADYPVTPDVFGEVWNGVMAAAEEGRIPMGREEALGAVQMLAERESIPFVPDLEGTYDPSQVPPEYTQYSDSPVIQDYYYSEGPPVVTYYPPPWEYGYMYAWVPYPFWWSGVWFPGFFCLNDFHTVVVVKNVKKVVSNHVRNPKGKFNRLDPRDRTGGGRELKAAGERSGRRLDSSEARRGAESILRRSSERAAREKGAEGGSGRSGGVSGKGTPGSIPDGRALKRDGSAGAGSRGGNDSLRSGPSSPSGSQGRGRENPGSADRVRSLPRSGEIQSHGRRSFPGPAVRPERGSGPGASRGGTPEGFSRERSFSSPRAMPQRGPSMSVPRSGSGSFGRGGGGDMGRSFPAPSMGGRSPGSGMEGGGRGSFSGGGGGRSSFSGGSGGGGGRSGGGGGGGGGCRGRC
jgi:hypothetical protein